MSSEQLFFNGVNGTTGDYLTPPLTPAEVSKMAQGQAFDARHLADLKVRGWKEPDFAPIPQVGDVKDLSKTGWGVIFAHGADPRIKVALDELLSHRRNQAGELYREYSDWVLTRAGQETAYFPQDTANKFLARFGANSSNPVDPKKVPYYLLIVGDPEAIPYSFQYQLDVQYAVGRIYFETLEDYAQYAHSVVLAEKSAPFLSPKVRFVGTQNRYDRATKSSAENLVKPLAELLAKDQPHWDTQTILDTAATKTQLGNLLGGSETPALLFTASHGVVFDKSDSRQLRHQGALLASEGWFSGHIGSIPEDWYFSADDLSADAKLLGLIAFNFACFGAGTPRVDDFGYENIHWKDLASKEIAPHAFVARLPQKLLSHDKGGALAVIGHVDRAWGFSFGNDSSQLEAFQSTLFQLMGGYPVGAALEYFNQRYAALSAALTNDLDEINKGRTADPVGLSSKWIANNDARSYAIIGDPAVRLMVVSQPHPVFERPTTEPIVLQPMSTSPPPAQPAQPATAPEAVRVIEKVTITESAVPDYGLPNANVLKQTQQKLVDALQQFSEQLSQSLQKAIDDTASLQVSTYTSEDLSGVRYNPASKQFEGSAKLQALTRINLNGDTFVCLQEKDGKLDELLGKIHQEAVSQAQSQRTEMLKTTVSAATSLLSAFKVV
jgi:hypothetical protein